MAQLSSTNILGTLTVTNDEMLLGDLTIAATSNQLVLGTGNTATITATPTASRVFTLPDVTGTIITTGDTGSVTSTMLAGSIANAKLANSSVTIGSTAVSLGSTVTTFAGLTSVTSTTFVGALTGAASSNMLTASPNFTTSLSGNSKIALETGDSWLRINQSATFTSGIWTGTSNIEGGSGNWAMGSNGSGSTSRVYIVGGTYNGTNVIKLDGTNGTINAINLTLSGNLTVSGTTSTINTNTLAVDDKNIELGAVVSTTVSATGTVGTIAGTGPWTAAITGMTSTAGLVPGSVIAATNGAGSLGGAGSYVVTVINSETSINYTATGGTTPVAGAITTITTTGATDATANGGGITLKGATDKTIIWDSANTNWTSSDHWNLATGHDYKINNISVISATTLGSGVTGSSLTSVGTLTGLNVTSTTTTGNAITINANSLTSGQALNLGSTSTARANGSTVLGSYSSGANATASITAYGIFSQISNTGTTNTNIAYYATATNGSTTNYSFYGAAGNIYNAGSVGIGRVPQYALDVYSASVNQIISVESGLTTGTAYFQAKNNAGTVFQAIQYGSTASSTNFGLSAAGTSLLYSNSATAMVLGIAGAYPLILGTNNIERIRIDSAGDVGIGTSPSGTKLHVVNTVTGEAVIKLQNTHASGWSGIEFMKADGTGTHSYIGTEVGSNGGLRYNSSSGSGHVWYYSSAEKMRLDTNGNLGVGGTPPATTNKIYVYGSDSGSNGIVKVESSANSSIAIKGAATTNYAYISFWQGATNTFEVGTDGASSTGNFYINNTVQSGSNGSPFMINKSTGNVGIGTTSPGVYKLYVANGTGANVASTIDVGYTTAGASDFGALQLYRSGTNVVGDGIGLVFSALTSTSAMAEYAELVGQIETNTNGSQAGRLVFKTTDNGAVRSEKMRLTSTGNLGINKTAPVEKLHVAGDARIDDTAGNAGFKMSFDNTTKTLNFIYVGA